MVFTVIMISHFVGVSYLWERVMGNKFRSRAPENIVYELVKVITFIGLTPQQTSLIRLITL